jgi:hypothetical protein
MLSQLEVPMAESNQRVKVIEDRAGIQVIRVPAALLERFLEVVRQTGVEFVVESNGPESKTVRLTSATDHARIAAALDHFNTGHVREE